MGLLAPLYALATLAVVGPIVFHLIRRQPQGQAEFSSLMFLQPSPPRLTRRSRVEHWLLLMLRVLALVLIALAFARPYLREQDFAAISAAGERVVVLVDTSASMRRPGVWEQAQREVDQLLASCGAHDYVGLYAIDSRLRPIVPWDTVPTWTPSAMQQAVRAEFDQITPSWHGTHLADGLMAVADLLAIPSDKEGPATTDARIVLISDLHQDSGLEQLQGYPWPATVRLDVRQVQPRQPGNARLTILPPDVNVPRERVRVRVENNMDSVQQNLRLTWGHDGHPLPGDGTVVQVPPGQVRVVPMPPRPPSGDCIVLTGDAWSGDNVEFFLVPQLQEAEVLVAAPPVASQEDDFGYFIEKMPLDTPWFQRRVQRVSLHELTSAIGTKTKAILVEPHGQTMFPGAVLAQFVRQGGVVVVVLAHTLETPEPVSRGLSELLGWPPVAIEEAAVDGYALIGAINYRHPLFQPFADPRFNDFSKIRLWRYRRLHVPEAEVASVVARLDSGDPWIVHQRVGAGHVWILTAGPQPTGSTFALSSKFVPIVLRMLAPDDNRAPHHTTIEVGQPLRRTALWSESPDGEAARAAELQVRADDGQPVGEADVHLEEEVIVFHRPGRYTIQQGAHTSTCAVVVPLSESRLTPLDPDVFEQYGVPLGRVRSARERLETARQLQIGELEQRQRLWRWLLVAGMIVLGGETAIGGCLAQRRRATE
ncbi:MAG: inter-alpha-trypsin inhibitor heavy chain H2 [precursor] [Pirellulaceae bacterium]|nr:MAG: inter-alpha-trypsin inhibitor heavy chain H2 [precursor] [Pirellulaceae bacterium]